METFDLLKLPLVAQDEVVKHITQTFTPENGIQFAQTSQYSNWLYRRARPRRIIFHLMIQTMQGFSFRIGSFTGQSIEQLMEILSRCRVEALELRTNDLFRHERPQYSQLLQLLTEASDGISKLVINFTNWPENDLFLDFYGKLKNLTLLDLSDDSLIKDLPFIPPKLKLQDYFGDVAELFRYLATKSEVCPFSYFKISTIISIDILHDFLQNAKFTLYGRILAAVDAFDSTFYRLFITSVGNGVFEFQFYNARKPMICIDQKLLGENKRVLKFSLLEGTQPEFYDYLDFFLTKSSKPTEAIVSGKISVDDPEDVTIEDIDKKEWIKFTIVNSLGGHIYYSNQMLDDAFPRGNRTSGLRANMINKVLKLKIVVMEPKELKRFLSKVRDLC